jgi:hypothetical protein
VGRGGERFDPTGDNVVHISDNIIRIALECFLPS